MRIGVGVGVGVCIVGYVFKRAEHIFTALINLHMSNLKFI